MANPVQVAFNSGSGNPITVTFGLNITAGNAVVVCVFALVSAADPTVSPGSGADTYSLAVVDGDFGVAVHYVLASAGGYNSVTVSINGGGASMAWAYEVSGLTALDQTSATDGASASSFTSGATATTTQANEVAFGVGGIGNDTTATSIAGPSSPWVNETGVNSFTIGAYKACAISGYQILTAKSAATYSGTASTTASDQLSVAAIATFKYTPPPASSDMPAIRPGPTWLEHFKPWLARPRPSAPPAGPYFADLPNRSDMPAIRPGPTWLARFKPGLRRPRPYVADPGAAIPANVALPAATVTISAPAPAMAAGPLALTTATITIAALAPALPGTILPLTTATVTISAPPPGIIGGVGLALAAVTISAPSPAPRVGVALPAAAVTISAPAPSTVGGVGVPVATVTIAAPAPAPRVAVGLPVAAVTISAPAPAPRVAVALPVAGVAIGTPVPAVTIINLSSIPAIRPGPTWGRRFKGMRPLTPPHTREISLALTTARVTVAAPAPAPRVAVGLTTATVAVRAWPVAFARNLILSLASQDGTDDYGNTYPAGVQVGASTDHAQVQLLPSGAGSAASVAFPVPSLNLATDGSIAGGLTPSGEGAQLVISGPAQTIQPTAAQIILQSSDPGGDISAGGVQFVAIDTSGDPTLIAFYNSTAWQFDAPALAEDGMSVDGGLTVTSGTFTDYLSINGQEIVPQPTPAADVADIIAALQAAGIFT